MAANTVYSRKTLQTFCRGIVNSCIECCATNILACKDIKVKKYKWRQKRIANWFGSVRYFSISACTCNFCYIFLIALLIPFPRQNIWNIFSTGLNLIKFEFFSYWIYIFFTSNILEWWLQWKKSISPKSPFWVQKLFDWQKQKFLKILSRWDTFDSKKSLQHEKT